MILMCSLCNWIEERFFVQLPKETRRTAKQGALLRTFWNRRSGSAPRKFRFLKETEINMAAVLTNKQPFLKDIFRLFSICWFRKVANFCLTGVSYWFSNTPLNKCINIVMWLVDIYNVYVIPVSWHQICYPKILCSTIPVRSVVILYLISYGLTKQSLSRFSVWQIWSPVPY